jgi:hypothetical protein
MADELEALRRITGRRAQAERDWRDEILRLFAAGHSIQVISAAAGVRYEEIVRPRELSQASRAPLAVVPPARWDTSLGAI